MTKTEEDIEREKEAVKAMIGAKGAAEKLISRNERLVFRLSSLIDSLDELKKPVGDLYIRTYKHRKSSSGDAHVLLLRDFLEEEIKLIRDLL